MSTRGVIHGASGLDDGERTHWSWVSFDLDQRVALPAIPLTFFAHGLAVDPRAPQRAAVFEKHGPGACLVDLAARQVIAPITTAVSRQFYGHGVFVNGGAAVLATETEVERDRAGVIVIRDGDDLRVIGEFPSFGRAPHDCVVVDGGSTLVVTNGGGARGEPDPPCVTWIDIKSGKLRDRMLIPDERFDAGHLAVTSAGDLAVVSAPRFGTPSPLTSRGGFTLRPHGGSATTVDAPAEVVANMIGETLSVAISEQAGVVAVTNPSGHQLAFWRLSDGGCLGALRVPAPRGVTLSQDQREFVVAFGITGKISCVDVRSLRPTDDPGNRDGVQVGTTGSHLFRHGTAVGGRFCVESKASVGAHH